MAPTSTNENKYPLRRYSSEEAALDRVDSLRQYGIWPGVVRYHDGRFGLTYDPGFYLLQRRAG